MRKKGEKPHIYLPGQVVYWRNDHGEYVRIVSQTPLHCDLGKPFYIIQTSLGRVSCVPEKILRPLTETEIGAYRRITQ
jgi:hypothetical protein